MACTSPVPEASLDWLSCLLAGLKLVEASQATLTIYYLVLTRLILANISVCGFIALFSILYTFVFVASSNIIAQEAFVRA